MAATTGLGDSSSPLSSGLNTSPTRDWPDVILPNSLMSAPPQKLRPAPARTTARPASSFRQASRLARRPAITSGLRALTGGLLIVMTPTSPSRRRVTRSVMVRVSLDVKRRFAEAFCAERFCEASLNVSAQLEQPGRPLAAADAHRHDAVPDLAPLHLVGQRADQARAGHAVGVAERNRAAVDVQLLRVDPQAIAAVDDLHGERLVQLPQVDVADRQAVPL